MPNTGSGRLGEQLTAEYLEEKGYEIVERNFKCRFGEIDVIAQNDRYL
ncbi:MAG TPA: YraN family protein, partial [Ruminococcaceae bacterium]|nr:YraN family protein [Oscillospiraceae bacterium]